MNNLYKILFIILLFSFVIAIIFLFSSKDNKDDNDNKNYLLPDNSELARDNNFYKKYKDDTLKYLLAVYPNGKESLEKLNYMELAKFYNSLWFYYNCDSQFAKQNIVQPIWDENENSYIQKGVESCWNPLPGCGDKYPKLPYTPQGYVYSFNNWLQDWTPWINSDSTVDAKNITGSFPGQTFANFYNGPSPVWMYQRAIFRNVYSTNLPSIDYMLPIPRSYPDMFPGNNGEWKSEWNSPNNWWNCVADNGYVEVTCASEPGMATSPPLLWVDGWCGSGIFFNVGKSFRSKNKSSAAFFLAKEMTNTVEGAAKLKEWFNSSDPYEILKNFIYSNGNDSRFAGINGPTIAGTNGKPIPNCNMLYNNQNNPISLPYLPTNKTEGDYSQSRDWGFWGTESVNTQDYYSWCKKAKNNNMNEIPNSCIDDIIQDKNYPAGRLNNSTLFDEASFIMGLWLGYDSIQLSMSPNGAGFWQYEVMVLYDYPEEVKNRNYSSFIELQTKGDFNVNVNGDKCPVYQMDENGKEAVGGVKYKDNFVSDYMTKITKYFSLRDPLDVYNNDKAENITLDAKWDPKNEYNITVKNHISSMFTGMPILGQDSDQCKNTIPKTSVGITKRNVSFKI